MRITISAVILSAALTAVPAVAQDSQTTQQEQAPANPDSTLSMGETVAPTGDAPGTAYLKSEHGPWQVRCLRTENGTDPCQLYQLLQDEQGNSVAEFTLFPLIPTQGEAVAGGNIVSPLETLLPEGVTLAVDGGEPRRFPFAFCTQAGCVSRVGFTQADIDGFKRGRQGAVGIVPVVAADRRVTLTLSLTGFTAGYDEVLAAAQAAAAAAPAAGQTEGQAAPAPTGSTGTTGGNN